MPNDKRPVLIFVDVQRDFTPRTHLPIYDGPLLVSQDWHIAGYEHLGVTVGDLDEPAAFLAMLARAWAEPPMAPPSHASFAKPGQPVFSVVPGPTVDFDQLWPRHCVAGTV